MAKGKSSDDELVKAFLYAPIEVPNRLHLNSEFPCHCGKTLKVNGSTSSHATAKCENGHYLVIAWKFVKDEPSIFSNYQCFRVEDDEH